MVFAIYILRDAQRLRLQDVLFDRELERRSNHIEPADDYDCAAVYEVPDGWTITHTTAKGIAALCKRNGTGKSVCALDILRGAYANSVPIVERWHIPVLAHRLDGRTT